MTRVRRNPWFGRIAVMAMVLFGLSVGEAWAQGAVKTKHGGWETRCETPPGAAAEQCAIVQSVVDQDRPNITLVVIALKTADRKSRLLRVITPLGVLLPTGLSLRLGKEDLGRMNFVRCLPNGCVAEVFLDDKLLAKLENGTEVTFVLFETPEEGVGVPASLAGFKDGFEALP
ncbi:MAG: invasion associated locus B family protein [Pseudomonadota bacterium]|nr:invasion associated locus B family protein [Pseudomonadota bacterium]